MSPWIVPVGAELAITLLFCGVLFYRRRSLTAKTLVFWLSLWVLRGAGSLIALRYVSSRESFGLLLYTPLQIAFALALVMIALRLENQRRELRLLHEELTRLRKEAGVQMDLDPLTGLLNRSALSRWMEHEDNFEGLVVVCDMDDFKPLNDLYGHLVGDEILHGVGKLVRGSIRDEDLAFRWGGDEFVIFFRNEDRDLVESRMRALERRLEAFHIRQHGVISVRFSWGTATATGRPLRQSVEEADRLMYESKRARRLAGKGAVAGGQE